jgi:membrane associated rhomboid family serine protease
VAITFHVFFGFDAERIATIFKNWGATPTDLHPRAWVTHLFLHAGPEHLVGNLAFLVLFGMNVERRLGALATLVLYFLSGFAALALFTVFNSRFSMPLVGASGAISGIVGMYLVLFRKRTVEVMWFAFVVGGIVRLPALVVASFWIGLELLQAVLLNDRVMVAHWAHVGGFAGGFLLTPILLRVWRGHPEVYAADTKRRVRDTFEEKSYIPEAPAAPRADGLRLVAREWRPVTALVRKIVDGVSPGAGAFATPARLAGGLGPPQADDLRARLERAGFPADILPQQDEAPAAPLVFIDRLETAPDGIVVIEPSGTRRHLDRGLVIRVQIGTTRGSTPIVDIVTRDPWRRFRLSGATASVPVAEAALALRTAWPELEERGASFESLEELDGYFRWRLQRAV